MYKQHEDTNNAIKGLPIILRAGFSKLLEEKGVAAGNITKDVLECTIRKILADAGLGGNVSDSCEQPRADISQHSLYFWDINYHHLPEEFEFPSTDPLTASWKLG
ncbi:hypothetical protein JG688_00016472 [Phytophthora aleatoria]|uniref:Uncharacterized protein n=1 Tax=Phytophthora aleatoria TaxID=2496075 RepID=A0A8J5MCF3_9STRA|nr:hypothetical protein JG688_00016472 [Phytophthora aleatoria]